MSRLLVAAVGAIFLLSQNLVYAQTPQHFLVQPKGSAAIKLYNITPKTGLQEYLRNVDSIYSTTLSTQPKRKIEDRLFYPPRTDWTDGILGFGVDVTGYPSLITSQLPAFSATARANAPYHTNGASSTAAYYENEQKLSESNSSSDGVDLGFSIGDFSLGFDFSSEHMHSSQTDSNKAFYVYRYHDLRTTDFVPSSLQDLTPDAKNAFTPKNYSKFQNLYGSHYITKMTTGANLVIVFTITGNTKREVDGFKDATGLDVGAGVFDIGFKQKMSDATSKYAKSIKVESRVFASGEPALGLSQKVQLDPDQIDALRQKYTDKINVQTKGLPVISYQIRPYTQLKGLLDTPLMETLGDSLTTLADMNYSQLDLLKIQNNSDFYPFGSVATLPHSAPTASTTSLAANAATSAAVSINDFVDSVDKQKINLLDGMHEAIFLDEPLQAGAGGGGSTVNTSAFAVKKLKKVITDWNTFLSTIKWPSYQNQVFITIKQGPTSNLYLPEIVTRQLPKYRMVSCAVHIQNPTVPVGTPVPSAAALDDLNEDRELVCTNGVTPGVLPSGQASDVYDFSAIDLSVLKPGATVFIDAVDVMGDRFRFTLTDTSSVLKPPAELAKVSPMNHV